MFYSADPGSLQLQAGIQRLNNAKKLWSINPVSSHGRYYNGIETHLLDPMESIKEIKEFQYKKISIETYLLSCFVSTCTN
jgi:hypothetical protein